MLGRLVVFSATAYVIILLIFKTLEFHSTIHTHAHLMLSKEYHLHACGRAISAFANFSEAAKSKTIRRHSTSDDIQFTLHQIQAAIHLWYQRHYLIKGSACHHQKTFEQVARVYLRNADAARPGSPNFAYRILIPSRSEIPWILEP